MAVDAQGLDQVGIVGAGAMGAGIAQTALTAGLKVILHDTQSAMLDGAREQILARIARRVEKGELPTDARQRADANLLLANELSAFSATPLVIEAIIEKLEPKQSLFVALEKIVGPDTVLATNTSSLSVASIARRCERRGRVCGMHFFNPVPLMKLVEVVHAPETTQRTIEIALWLSSRLNKTAVRVQDVPGFLVNLLGRAYTTEALHIQLEGVAPADVIDRIMREAATFRMGPFELMDLTGIDVNFPATTAIYQGFQHDPRLKTTIRHEALFNAGQFGRKTGQGFHRYSEGAQTSDPQPDMAAPAVLCAFIAQPDPGFTTLAGQGLRLAAQEVADVILIAPQGEDATTTAATLKLDPSRVVAIDFLGLERKFLTLMAPPGACGCAETVAGFLRGKGYSVAVVKDSPGFVAPRILSMIANLGCEVAQLGVGTPEDIDLAMRLAQNYPRGPLEWAEWLGTRRVLETLTQIQAITGSDRYRPSLWLRRRALLGLPVYTRD
jgi:3-hydroxybutyryl-CoA dehydrogenase